VCRICIVPGLGRDIDCRRMGNGSVRLVAVAAVAAVAVVVAAVKVDVDVGIGVAAAAAAVKADAGVDVAEAVPEAGSLNTCPS
jgi:hypothetical protein